MDQIISEPATVICTGNECESGVGFGNGRVDPRRTVEVKALLDSAAGSSSVSESVARSLGPGRRPVHVNLTGYIPGNKGGCRARRGARETGFAPWPRIPLDFGALVSKTLTAAAPTQPTPEVVWPRIEGLPLTDEDFREEISAESSSRSTALILRERRSPSRHLSGGYSLARWALMFPGGMPNLQLDPRRFWGSRKWPPMLPEQLRYEIASRREFLLTTVTHGTASALYLASRVLQQLAEDERLRLPLGPQVLRRHVYVDDILAGADDGDAIHFLHGGRLAQPRGEARGPFTAPHRCHNIAGGPSREHRSQSSIDNCAVRRWAQARRAACLTNRSLSSTLCIVNWKARPKVGTAEAGRRTRVSSLRARTGWTEYLQLGFREAKADERSASTPMPRNAGTLFAFGWN